MSSHSHLYCVSMEGGIYRASFTGGSAPLSDFVRLPDAPGTFFLARHPRLPVLYSLDIGGKRVHALSISPSGDLTPLNEVSTEGSAPCHLAVDADRRKLVVANYNGGVALFSILPDGSLSTASSVFEPTGSGKDPKRQDKPHPHGVTLADGLVYVADLGADRLFALRIEKDVLQPEPALDVSLAPGSGPRHFALHPSGLVAACVNELDNTVTSFRCDPATGRLTPVSTLPTLPADFTGTSWTAEIDFHPTQPLLIATNRGHDTLALYRIDPRSAELEATGLLPAGGEKPQHFLFSPEGDFLFVANTGGERESGNVVLFQINPATLAPEEIQRTAIPQPMCLLLQ